MYKKDCHPDLLEPILVGWLVTCLVVKHVEQPGRQAGRHPDRQDPLAAGSRLQHRKCHNSQPASDLGGNLGFSSAPGHKYLKVNMNYLYLSWYLYKKSQQGRDFPIFEMLFGIQRGGRKKKKWKFQGPFCMESPGGKKIIGIILTNPSFCAYQTSCQGNWFFAHLWFFYSAWAT